ncbi:hypothetical protein J6X96_07880 [bacterium]|nr:hypothetical protein [bacterium]
MPNKRLLIVSFIFPPQLLARSLQLLKTANALSKAGWDLTVYTADPKLLKDKLDPALSEKLDKRIKLIPGYTFENWFFSNATASLSLGMPDDKYAWRCAGKAALKKLLEKESFDCVASFGLQWSSHLLAKEVKKFSDLPWLAHFSDPWVDNAYHRRIWPISAVNRAQERSVAELADKLCFTTEAAQKLVLGKYSKDIQKKGLTVPHCFDKALYPEAEPFTDKLHLVHVGCFYGRHNPLNFFQALKIFFDKEPRFRSQIVAHFVGLDPRKYQSEAKALGLEENLDFVPKVPYLESLGWMKKANALFSIDVVKNSLLSKLPDYVGSGKPILAVSDKGSPTSRYVEKLHGLTAEQSDVNDIAEKLETLAKTWEKDPDLKAYRYTEEESSFFSSENTTAILSEALQGICR